MTPKATRSCSTSARTPVAGRRMSPFESTFVHQHKIWSTELLDTPEDVKVTVLRKADSVTLRVAARHPRPKSPKEALVGAYDAEIFGNGIIRVSYKYTPTNATGHFPEAGLTLVLLDEHWPAPLVRRFGQPAAAMDVFKPFHHSYAP